MINFQNIRISIYSHTLFRIEYQPDKQFEDKPKLLMGTKLPPEIPVSVKEKDNKIIVKTDSCKLIYEKKGNDFSKDVLEVEFKHGNKTKKWTRNAKHSYSIPEVYRSLDEHPSGPKRYPEPIIINSDGWHSIQDNSGVYWDEKTDWPIVQKRPYYENLYLFFYGKDIHKAFKDFITLFGKTPLIPRQAFGSWYSRWYDYKDKELRELMKNYQKHQLPLDVLVVDVDWHKHHWNGYDWEKESFPEPDKFIKHVKKAGLKLVLNDHPGYDSYDPLPEDDTCLPKLQKEINEPPYKGMWACDWSRKSIVGKWSKYCLEPLLKNGIDWWWIDGWGDYPFPDTNGQLWLNWQYYDTTQKLNPKKRVLILSRWGGIGSHRYPVQFSGDTHANFENIKYQIHYTAYSGGLGASYWSHDIGGFHEGEIDEDVYIRWVQFGALSPIFRTHSNHGTREPYNFSSNALSIYRKFIYLRYKLLPYMEQLQFNNYLSGVPLTLPMYFMYPEKKDAYRFTEQYFLGESLLVAPVHERIQNETITKSVWIPDGKWLDVLSGVWVSGEQIIEKKVSIEEMPLFIKNGSIIPCTPVKFPITTGDYKEIIFNIFGCEEKKEEILYFDDGETMHDFEPDKVSKIAVNYKVANNEIILNLNICSDYSHKYLPKKFTFCWYVGSAISEINFNGKNINYQSTKNELIYQFTNKKLNSLQWSIDAKDLKEKNEWVIEI